MPAEVAVAVAVAVADNALVLSCGAVFSARVENMLLENAVKIQIIIKMKLEMRK